VKSDAINQLEIWALASNTCGFHEKTHGVNLIDAADQYRRENQLHKTQRDNAALTCASRYC
jgi:hypothetical protein